MNKIQHCPECHQNHTRIYEYGNENYILYCAICGYTSKPDKTIMKAVENWNTGIKVCKDYLTHIRDNFIINSIKRPE